MAKLDDDQRELNQRWKEKEHYLNEMLDLQLFNTEAERIDAATKGHEAFLEIKNLGVCVLFFDRFCCLWQIQNLLYSKVLLRIRTKSLGILQVR